MSLFPITDPSRAADIRMRRRRAVYLLGGTALVLMMLGRHSPPMRAQTGSTGNAGARDATSISATGSTLEVSVACANSITLVPAANLAGTVFVSAHGSKDSGGQGSGGQASGGQASGGQGSGGHGLVLQSSQGVLHLSSACRHGRPDLVIQAPPAMGLTIEQSGATDLRLGAFTGPVRLVHRGSGDMVLDQSGALDVVMSGNGDLSVGLLRGDLHLVQSGSGDTAIDRAEAGSIDAVMTGSGDLAVTAGHVGRLSATLHGSGDLSGNAEIGEATIRSGEDSDITLPHVKGRLDHTIATD